MGVGKERFEKLRIILPYFFSLSRNRALVPLLCIVLLPSAKLFMANDVRKALKENRETVYIAVVTTVFYLIYELSLLMMYMFSMSLGEMINQNGKDYYRYNGTVVAVVLSVLFLMMTRESESQESEASLAWLYAGVCILAIFYGVNFHINRMVSFDSMMESYPDLYLMEQIMNTDTIGEDDYVLVRYHKNYGIPAAGLNYYLYPCENYTVVYDKNAYERALQSGQYSVMIDLVNGSVQNSKGKESLDSYLSEN